MRNLRLAPAGLTVGKWILALCFWTWHVLNKYHCIVYKQGMRAWAWRPGACKGFLHLHDWASIADSKILRKYLLKCVLIKINGLLVY